MATKIKLTKQATKWMYHVQQRIGLDKKPDLYTLRIAFARSLQFLYPDKKIDKIPDNDDSPRTGKEIEVSTLEQKDRVILRALLQQFYGSKLTDDEYAGCLEKHIEHGLYILYKDTEKMSGRGQEHLLNLATSDVRYLKQVNSNISVAEGYSDVLSITIGKEIETQESFSIRFNDTKLHSNNYMAVMGKPGSGKTHFIKDFLIKLREASGFKTHFIIFDYAKGDIADDVGFIEKSKARLVDVDKEKMPLNFFKMSGKDSKEKVKVTEKLTDIFQSLDSKIGEVQKDNLYKCVIQLYKKLENDPKPYPDFEMIKNELDDRSEKPDSLSSLLRPLVEQKIFSQRDEKVLPTLLKETLVVDIHKLSNDKLKNLCVFLTLSQLYRELMSLPDSNEKDGIREMRIVLVIDEAHHLLKDRKKSEILETLIREIRSKGASVVLLSQSPGDYDQSDFNYFELLEFIFVLSCNPSSDKFLKQAFGITTEKAKKIREDLNNLKTAEAYTKSSDGKLIKLDLWNKK